MTDSSGQVSASSRTNRLRGRCPWLDHVFRAVDWFGKHHGNYYAAAITYFSVLSVVPVLMVGFACAAVVLAGNHAMLVRLQTEIGTRVPGSLGDVINNLVREAVEARGTVGVIGLVVAIYSGVGWMTHLRGAVTEQWGLTRPKLPVVSTALKDLLALVGLGLALVVSFAVTAIVGAADTFVQLVGLAQYAWARILLTVVAILLAVLVNLLVFLWVIARLPRRPVDYRTAMSGALLAAAGFEVLKQLTGILLARIAHSPTGAVFGPAISLLVFANLVARLLLFSTAWAATSQPQPSAPAPL